MTHQFMRDLLQDGDGCGACPFADLSSFPNGTTPLFFKTQLDFGESPADGPNNTVVVRDNYVNIVAEALGKPCAILRQLMSGGRPECISSAAFLLRTCWTWPVIEAMRVSQGISRAFPCINT